MADLVRAHNWGCNTSWRYRIPGPMLFSRQSISCSPANSPPSSSGGPQMLQFYNDKYRPLMTDKHPSALGQSARECWKEAWHLIGPQFEAVLAHGETVYKEEVLVPVLRNGRLQDIYWTYSYSPIYDPLGAIDGILIVCHDVHRRDPRKPKTPRERSSRNPHSRQHRAMPSSSPMPTLSSPT